MSLFLFYHFPLTHEDLFTWLWFYEENIMFGQMFEGDSTNVPFSHLR